MYCPLSLSPMCTLVSCTAFSISPSNKTAGAVTNYIYLLGAPWRHLSFCQNDKYGHKRGYLTDPVFLGQTYTREGNNSVEIGNGTRMPNQVPRRNGKAEWSEAQADWEDPWELGGWNISSPRGGKKRNIHSTGKVESRERELISICQRG